MVDFRRAAKETINNDGDHGECPLHFKAEGRKVYDPHGRLMAACCEVPAKNGVEGATAEEVAGVIADTLTDMLHRHYAIEALSGALKDIFKINEE